MMQDFEESDLYLSAFVISVYVLGYAVGPLIISPLSEVYGRVVMYHICNMVFLVFTCLCGICHHLGTLAVMRFFAGCGGSAAFALGPATVADLVSFEKRGGMYAVLGMAYNLGPAISPLVGSYLNAARGWRWIFWLTGILGGLCAVAACALSESYEPVLLRRKAQHLRKETGNTNLHSVLDINRPASNTQILVGAMLRPLRMLFLLPNVFLVSLLTAVGYGYVYLLYTTLPATFTAIYGWPSKNIGLAYLGAAVGNLLGMACGGPLSDFIVRRRAAKGDNRPENRLIPMMFFWPLVTIGLIMYGWTAQKEYHWIWPLFGTAIFGMGAMSAIVSIRPPLLTVASLTLTSPLVILWHLRRRRVHSPFCIRRSCYDSSKIPARRPCASVCE
jgi:multidrug resistance protein